MRELGARWRAVAVITAVVAAGLHGYTGTVMAEGGSIPFVLGLFTWSMLPYVLGLLVGRDNPLAGALGVLPALPLDAYMYYSVFVAPDSSTAALGLLSMPAFNLLVVLPVGMLLGYAISRRQRRPA